MAKSGKKKQTSRRLPSGKYSWRGAAVPFSRIPKKERHRLRSGWSTKSARTRRQRAKAAKRQGVSKEFLDLVSGGKRGKKRGGRRDLTWSAKVGSKKVLPLVKAAKVKLYAALPETRAGVWSVRLAWPDDPRSGEGRPYMTFAGFEPTKMTRGLNEKDRDFARYVEEIRATNGAQLERSQRVSSGASGRVRVVSIHLLAW